MRGARTTEEQHQAVVEADANVRVTSRRSRCARGDAFQRPRAVMAARLSPLHNVRVIETHATHWVLTSKDNNCIAIVSVGAERGGSHAAPRRRDAHWLSIGAQRTSPRGISRNRVAPSVRPRDAKLPYVIEGRSRSVRAAHREDGSIGHTCSRVAAPVRGRDGLCTTIRVTITDARAAGIDPDPLPVYHFSYTLRHHDGSTAGVCERAWLPPRLSARRLPSVSTKDAMVMMVVERVTTTMMSIVGATTDRHVRAGCDPSRRGGILLCELHQQQHRCIVLQVLFTSCALQCTL